MQPIFLKSITSTGNTKRRNKNLESDGEATLHNANLAEIRLGLKTQSDTLQPK